MDQRRDDAPRLELVVEADALEQFQGRGMVRSRARHLFEEIVLAQRFDQADLHARLRHSSDRHSPTGPAPTTITRLEVLLSILESWSAQRCAPPHGGRRPS